MSAAQIPDSTGWTWPLIVVIVVHLGLAAIPLQFSVAENEEPARVQLKLTPVIPPEKPPEPEPVAQPIEPLPEIAPPPEPPEPPDPPPVVAEAPRHAPVEPAVAVVEDEPEIVEEILEPREVLPEPSQIPPEEPTDRERELTNPQPPEDPVAEPDPAPAEQPVAEPVDWQGYGRSIVNAVHGEQRYPRMAARRGLEGTATVRIVINNDGTLARSPELIDSTEHRSLDREALRMIEAAAPFDSLPTSQREQQEFVIPVRFRLQN